MDISIRKQSEEVLLRSEGQLRELNASKDKFFSIIAHDLRSPFNSIMGFSNLLQECVREKDFVAIEEFSGIIQKSSERVMWDLLNNLLDWSRTQTGRIEYIPEYLELVDLIQNVSQLFNSIANQKSIGIQLELPHNAIVHADKSMINTVLRNLISNAIKFTPCGGTIVISAAQTATETTVTVSDNGIGISQEGLGKLFRIDEGYSTQGTNEERGTGLGLILCKEFVEKNGGRIWVESQAGQGSRFFFTLPRN